LLGGTKIIKKTNPPETSAERHNSYTAVNHPKTTNGWNLKKAQTGKGNSVINS